MQIHPSKRRFTLTKEDFRWEYFTAGGHGGQNVQKTATAVRCVHEPSGATGIARDARSQPQNKRAAFERCVNSPLFKAWSQQKLDEIEAGQSAEQWVDEQMRPENLVVEVKDGRGKWVEGEPQS